MQFLQLYINALTSQIYLNLKLLDFTYHTKMCTLELEPSLELTFSTTPKYPTAKTASSNYQKSNKKFPLGFFPWEGGSRVC